MVDLGLALRLKEQVTTIDLEQAGLVLLADKTWLNPEAPAQCLSLTLGEVVWGVGSPPCIQAWVATLTDRDLLQTLAYIHVRLLW